MGVSLDQMNEEIQIQSHWTVDKTLTQKPETSQVFNKYQTQCVGCYMQKFCTLKVVTEIYQINLDEFLESLNDCETKNKN